MQRLLPAAWSELNSRQAWHCMDIIIRGLPRRRLLEYLLDMPLYMLRRVGTGQMYDLLKCIEWMDIHRSYTHPIAPYIDIIVGKSSYRLYLPSAQFSNVTGLEYVLLDDLYKRFIQDRNPEDEVRMISMMLRPSGITPDPASDQRVQLISSKQAEAWAPLVRSLPDSIRAYMTTLISANRDQLHSMYGPWLFSGSGIDTKEGEATPEPEGLNFGWWGAFLDIAQDGVFGDHDHVLQTPIHTICTHMIRKVDEARRRKQEHDHAMIRSGMNR